MLDLAPSSVVCASATARTYSRAFSRSEGSSDLKLTSICAALWVTALSFSSHTFWSCCGKARPILLSVTRTVKVRDLSVTAHANSIGSM